MHPSSQAKEAEFFQQLKAALEKSKSISRSCLA